MTTSRCPLDAASSMTFFEQPSWSGFYNVWKKGRPLGPLSNSNSLFRTRTVQNKLPRAARRMLPINSLRPSSGFYNVWKKGKKSRPLGPLSNSNSLFRTRRAARRMLPINSLRPSSGFYNVWKKEKGRPWVLFRTRRIAPIGSFAADSNCPKQASKGHVFIIFGSGPGPRKKCCQKSSIFF